VKKVGVGKGRRGIRIWCCCRGDHHSFLNFIGVGVTELGPHRLKKKLK